MGPCMLPPAPMFMNKGACMHAGRCLCAPLLTVANMHNVKHMPVLADIQGLSCAHCPQVTSSTTLTTKCRSGWPPLLARGAYPAHTQHPATAPESMLSRVHAREYCNLVTSSRPRLQVPDRPPDETRDARLLAASGLCAIANVLISR
jgi:hypothetical protein